MGKIQAQAFRQLLLYKRKAMTPAQRKRPVKVPMAVYPHAIERQMATDIKRLIMLPLTQRLSQILTKENYERWVADYARHDSRDIRDITTSFIQSHLRKDTYEDEINRIIGTLTGEMEAIIDGPSTVLRDSLLKSVTAEYTHSKGQWEMQTNKVLGQAFSTDEAWWEKTRKAWLNENITLIKSQPEEYIKKISDALYRGTRNGWAWGDMAESLQKINTSMSDYKAALIARDQVGKLNGQLSKYRQTEIGITTYTWQTSGDERVRDSHRLMDGTYCQWEDSSVYSKDYGKTWIPRPSEMQGLIPGEDIQCRCQAVANFDEIIGDVDQDTPDNTDSIERTDSIEVLPAVNDTLISDPILAAAISFIYNNARIDRTFDVPYLAGSSRDGSVVYIDRHLPEFLEYKGQKYNVLPLFVFHERTEYAIERGLNCPYQYAHQLVLRNEREGLAATLKIPWKVYDDFCQEWIKFADDEKLQRIPWDLDIKPYEDEDDWKALLAIQKQIGVGFK